MMEVDVLIGSDHYWELATGEVRRGDSGPVAIKTRLGWVLSGMMPASSQHQPSSASLSLISTHTLRIDGLPETTKSLDDTLRSFWELESLGIKNPERSVQEEFSENIHFKDGRYEVSLPWRESHPMLPDNYHLCEKRLQGLLRRLRQDPTVLREYDSIIQAQIGRGIVQEVECLEHTTVGQVHYLPHHAVIRRDKETSKVRIVYDASAKYAGPSLNECLYAGPKFDQRILDILLRFRVHRVALAADIEKAFLMVSISEEDRDVLRFLWIDDITKGTPEIRSLRFARVVFGVSSSPFLLNATIKHHLDSHSASLPELVEKLSKSIYVDDIITGAQDEDKAYQLFMESKAVLKRGGFKLRKFITNSSSLQQEINTTENEFDSRLNPQGMSDTEETYAKATLGPNQRMHSGD